MAIFYSDHLGIDGINDTTIRDPFTKTPAGIAHARVRVKTFKFDLSAAVPADGDIVRLGTFKSSDRFLAIHGSSDGNSTALSTHDLGLYLTGDDNDGAVLDINLFCIALDVAAGFANTITLLHESTSITDEDIGLQLWQMLALGAGSDIVDPVVNYDLAVTILNGLTQGGEERYTVYYTSGA